MDAAVEFEKLYEIVEPLVTRAVTCWKQWSPPEMSTTAQRLMMNWYCILRPAWFLPGQAAFRQA